MIGNCFPAPQPARLAGCGAAGVFVGCAGFWAVGGAFLFVCGFLAVGGVEALFAVLREGGRRGVRRSFRFVFRRLQLYAAAKGGIAKKTEKNRKTAAKTLVKSKKLC